MAPLVLIYVRRGGKKSGPFSEEEVVRRYHRGEFAGTDLAMVDGMTGWHPLSTYIVEDGDSTNTDFNPSARPDSTAAEVRPEGGEALPDNVAVEETIAPDPATTVVGEAAQRSKLFSIPPVTAAWTLLVLGVIVMVLSKWPWSLWLPLLAAAIVLSVLQIAKNNIAQGVPLLAVALLLPWFVWSQWLSPASPPALVTGSSVALATPTPLATASTPPPQVLASPAESAPALPLASSTPGSEPLPTIGDTPKSGMEATLGEPAPLPPELPKSAAPETAMPSITKGQRVALVQETRLFFQSKEFRLGQAGEEFDVLAIKADKAYLATKDTAGRTIAVSADLSNVRLASKEAGASTRKDSAPEDPARMQ